MTVNKRVEHVVIVGGGTAGWMTAAGLINYYKKNVNFTLIESSEIGTVGVGESTIATIRRFYATLGMQDTDVMRATQATCKLGIEFQHWYQQGASFIHPFGLFGQDVANVPFHHYWLKMQLQGAASDMGDYSLGVNMARAGKFTQPPDNPQNMLSVFDWALQFDASLFAKLMRDFAEHHGVRRIDAKVEQVNLKADNGFIESVKLDNGEVVSGDLFIDCSGFNGLLIEQALHSGYEDWSQWLVCDRAVTVQSELVGPPTPYTIAMAHQAGWQWKIPLQHRQGNGHVYSSQYISDDEAKAVLLNNIEGKLLNEPRQFKFIPGRRKQAWRKNCIAVGLAAGFLEPLESTSIALVETAIEKIRLLFPDKSMNQSVIDEFNEMTRLEYERVRDFIILHYHGTSRTDSPMWNYCRTMPIPDTLAHKMALFKQRGHLVKYRWEIFQPASWVALYTGMHILPQSYDPIVDNFDPEYLRTSLDAMKKSINQAVAATPSHADFIAQHCAAANK
ncbi:tryptophan halogenase family protein [Neptunicella sp.]|uniref:tryptophan halogenase family protein n=1 Tax=Neptunicella sp. TaxID=2125986 RepID=UPI003F68D617